MLMILLYIDPNERTKNIRFNLKYSTNTFLEILYVQVQSETEEGSSEMEGVSSSSFFG